MSKSEIRLAVMGLCLGVILTAQVYCGIQWAIGAK